MSNFPRTDQIMLLSIAESVKSAREHNLNCRRPAGDHKSED